MCRDGRTTEAVLENQYERVLVEYRFQVQLNWDRAKHYLTFNTLVLGAAVALSKGTSNAMSYGGVSALLIIAGLNSYFGQLAVAKGHEYYRAIRSTKAELELALRLEAYAITTTPGMKRDRDIAPAGTPETGASRLGRITQQVRLLLAVIGVLAFGGAVCAAYAAVCVS